MLSRVAGWGGCKSGSSRSWTAGTLWMPANGTFTICAISFLLSTSLGEGQERGGGRNTPPLGIGIYTSQANHNLLDNLCIPDPRCCACGDICRYQCPLGEAGRRPGEGLPCTARGRWFSPISLKTHTLPSHTGRGGKYPSPYPLPQGEEGNTPHPTLP